MGIRTCSVVKVDCRLDEVHVLLNVSWHRIVVAPLKEGRVKNLEYTSKAEIYQFVQLLKDESIHDIRHSRGLRPQQLWH